MFRVKKKVNRIKKYSLFLKDNINFLLGVVICNDDFRYCSTAIMFDNLCQVNATKHEKIKNKKRDDLHLLGFTTLNGNPLYFLIFITCI